MSARQVLVLFGVCSALFSDLEASQISYRKFSVIILSFFSQKGNTQESTPIYKKTELRLSDFQYFHWLDEHKLSVHTPAVPNMVKERVSNKGS